MFSLTPVGQTGWWLTERSRVKSWMSFVWLLVAMVRKISEHVFADVVNNKKILFATAFQFPHYLLLLMFQHCRRSPAFFFFASIFFFCSLILFIFFFSVSLIFHKYLLVTFWTPCVSIILQFNSSLLQCKSPFRMWWSGRKKKASR